MFRVLNYIDEIEASKILGISKYTLKSWRLKHEGPKYYLLPKKRLRYLESDLSEWIENNKKTIGV